MIFRLVFFFSTISFAPTAAQTVTVFEELFPNPGGAPAPSQDNELRLQGWCGGNAGDPFCANGPNDPPPADNDGGEGAISGGMGQGGDVGFAFWSQTAIGADSFMYTPKFNIVGCQLAGATLTWFQRDNEENPGDFMHLAFLIGSTWYISFDTFTTSSNSVWFTRQALLQNLAFFTRAQVGTDLPDGGVDNGQLPGVSLPLADIAAIGFWWDGPKTPPPNQGTSRVDTVRLLAPDLNFNGIADACEQEKKKSHWDRICDHICRD